MFSFVPSSRIDRLEARVRQQAAAIEQICAQLGIDPTAVDPLGRLDAEETRLAQGGEPIAAIKHFRQRTGAGLGEAKRIVDDAMR